MNRWIIAAIAGIVGMSSIFFLNPDNPIENASEVVIKQETGVDIEFDDVYKKLEELRGNNHPINPLLPSPEK